MIKGEEDGAEVVSTIRRDLGIQLTVVDSGHIVAGTGNHRYKAAIAVSNPDRNDLLRFRAMSNFSSYKSSLEVRQCWIPEGYYINFFVNGPKDMLPLLVGTPDFWPPVSISWAPASYSNPLAPPSANYESWVVTYRLASHDNAEAIATKLKDSLKRRYFSRRAGADVLIEVTPSRICTLKRNEETRLLPGLPPVPAAPSTTMGFGRIELGGEITQDHKRGTSSNTDKQTHGVPNKRVKSHPRRIESPPGSPPSSLRSYREDNDGAVLGTVERVEREPVEREGVETVGTETVEREPIERDRVERESVEREPAEREPIEREGVEREGVETVGAANAVGTDVGSRGEVTEVASGEVTNVPSSKVEYKDYQALLEQTEKMYGWWKKAEIKLKAEQEKNGVVDRSEYEELTDWRMAAVDAFLERAKRL